MPDAGGKGSEQRQHVLAARVNAEEERRLRRAADAQGISVGAFIGQAVVLAGWPAGTTTGSFQRTRGFQPRLPRRPVASWGRHKRTTAPQTTQDRSASGQLPAQRSAASCEVMDRGASADRRQLLLILEPADLRSLAVTIGQHTVFLPALDQPRPFEATAVALDALASAPGPRPGLLGTEVP